MRKREASSHRLRGWVQNVLIVALLLSALFLLGRTGLIRQQVLPPFLAGGSSESTLPSGSKESSVMPVRIVTQNGGRCAAWLNETTADAIYETFGPFLAEAVGSASTPEAIDQALFRQALDENGIYFDYTTALPMSCLRNLFDGTGTLTDSSIRALCLSVQDSVVWLYGWDGRNSNDAIYFRCSTAVSATALQSALADTAGSGAEFAFRSGVEFSDLSPYTILPESTLSLPDLSCSRLSTLYSTDELLSILDFNAHTNSRYTESNGTEVIKQSPRLLRISPDGIIEYSGGSADDSAALLMVAHATEQATLSEGTDAVRHLGQSLLSVGSGDTALYLLSAQQDGDTYQIAFGYLVNGSPVFLSGADAALSATVENNVITAFTFRLCSYSQSESSHSLLPAAQAAAAVRNNPGELFPGYYDTGGDTLTAAWLRRSDT